MPGPELSDIENVQAQIWPGIKERVPAPSGHDAICRGPMADVGFACAYAGVSAKCLSGLTALVASCESTFPLPLARKDVMRSMACLAFAL